MSLRYEDIFRHKKSDKKKDVTSERKSVHMFLRVIYIVGLRLDKTNLPLTRNIRLRPRNFKWKDNPNEVISDDTGGEDRTPQRHVECRGNVLPYVSRYQSRGFRSPHCLPLFESLPFFLLIIKNLVTSDRCILSGTFKNFWTPVRSLKVKSLGSYPVPQTYNLSRTPPKTRQRYKPLETWPSRPKDLWWTGSRTPMVEIVPVEEDCVPSSV